MNPGFDFFMNRYQLASGTLHAKVVNHTDDYVFLELKFSGQSSKIKKLTSDSFDGLDKWVEENYDLCPY